MERTFSQSQQESSQLSGRPPGIRELVPGLEGRAQDGGLPQTSAAAGDRGRQVPPSPGE